MIGYVRSERYTQQGLRATWTTNVITETNMMETAIAGELSRLRRIASKNSEIIAWRIRYDDGQHTVTMAQWGDVP